jgi:methylmalonyl-CoA mutase
MTAPLPLADIFPPVSESEWRARASAAGGQAAASAVHGDDGIVVDPIYRRAANPAVIAARPAGTPWAIFHRLAAAGPASAADEAAAATAGGAHGVAAVFEPSAHPLSGRLPIAGSTDTAAALARAIPTGTVVELDAGEATPLAAASFVEMAASNNWRLSLAFDPIATRAARDGLPPSDDVVAAVVAAARLLERSAIDGNAAIADGRIWHAGGASEAQELAAALATVVWLLRLFEANDLLAEHAMPRIGVTLAADADQFLTIAKFRAARLLLARLFEAAGFPASSPALHAETAWRMMGRANPHANILRTTVAAFAAAVGGVDSITVLPFDALAAGSDEVGPRLARNAQAILVEESQLFRVADPAAGSGAIEALTTSLADCAWQQFRAIERAGGITSVLSDGSLCNEIATVRNARFRRIRSGELEMLGVDPRRRSEAGGGERPSPDDPAGAALMFTRLSEAFEPGLESGVPQAAVR